jgi:hypothetical protein
MSGDVTIDNTGTTSIASGVIVNADVNASAAIAVSKLAALSDNTAVVLTDGSGKLVSTPNGTAGYVLTSNGASAPTWQAVGGTGTVTSVNASGGTTGLSFSGGPVTTIGTLTVSGTLSYANGGTDQTFWTTGDLLYASGANTLTKRAVGAANQILTVSGGVPTWSSSASLSTLTVSGTSTLAAVTSSSTGEFVGGIRTSASGAYLLLKVVDIGNWDMDNVASVDVAHGLASSKKIRNVSVVVRSDSDNDYDLLNRFDSTSFIADGYVEWTYSSGGVANIRLRRRTGGYFDAANYSTTSFNRGYITILYEA